MPCSIEPERESSRHLTESAEGLSTTSQTRRKLTRLVPLIEPADTLLVVLQDSPDPDAIASAGALRTLARSITDITCTVVHGGVVGRAENRALVRYLGVNLRNAADVDPSRFDIIAMVDTQPGAGNNAFRAGVLPHVVIDHHPVRKETRRCSFTDVRSRCGATSSILFEYLREAEVTPEAPVATALLYGICSDTQDMGREATRMDVEAYMGLYPLANKRMLGRIRNASVPRGYFRLMATALAEAVTAGEGVFSYLGAVANPDMVPEIADLLLRHDGSTWALTCGFREDTILLSLRTTDGAADAGRIMRRLVGRAGSGGGHQMMAGGQIPVVSGSGRAAVLPLVADVRCRFLRFLKVGPDEVVPLLRSPRGTDEGGDDGL